MGLRVESLRWQDNLLQNRNNLLLNARKPAPRWLLTEDYKLIPNPWCTTEGKHFSAQKPSNLNLPICQSMLSTSVVSTVLHIGEIDGPTLSVESAGQRSGDPLATAFGGDSLWFPGDPASRQSATSDFAISAAGSAVPDMQMEVALLKPESQLAPDLDNFVGSSGSIEQLIQQFKREDSHTHLDQQMVGAAMSKSLYEFLGSGSLCTPDGKAPFDLDAFLLDLHHGSKESQFTNTAEGHAQDDTFLSEVLRWEGQHEEKTSQMSNVFGVGSQQLAGPGDGTWQTLKEFERVDSSEGICFQNNIDELLQLGERLLIPLPTLAGNNWPAAKEPGGSIQDRGSTGDTWRSQSSQPSFHDDLQQAAESDVLRAHSSVCGLEGARSAHAVPEPETPTPVVQSDLRNQLEVFMEYFHEPLPMNACHVSNDWSGCGLADIIAADLASSPFADQVPRHDLAFFPSLGGGEAPATLASGTSFLQVHSGSLPGANHGAPPGKPASPCQLDNFPGANHVAPPVKAASPRQLDNPGAKAGSLNFCRSVSAASAIWQNQEARPRVQPVKRSCSMTAIPSAQNDGSTSKRMRTAGRTDEEKDVLQRSPKLPFLAAERGEKPSLDEKPLSLEAQLDQLAQEWKGAATIGCISVSTIPSSIAKTGRNSSKRAKSKSSGTSC